MYSIDRRRRSQADIMGVEMTAPHECHMQLDVCPTQTVYGFSSKYYNLPVFQCAYIHVLSNVLSSVAMPAIDRHHQEIMQLKHVRYVLLLVNQNSALFLTINIAGVI